MIMRIRTNQPPERLKQKTKPPPEYSVNGGTKKARR